MTARMIMKLRVGAAVAATPDTLHLRLVHPTRPQLPAWTPGAHVDLLLPDGRVRQYSLCGDPSDRAGYDIAVKREDEGRGGSLWIHANLRAGAVAHVSAPRNNFPLAETAARHILVAGGIGVTPILAMARGLSTAGEDFTVHLCAKSEAATPLLVELRAVCGARLQTWFSAAGRRFAPEVLGASEDGSHVYACGPLGLLDALTTSALSAGWRAEQIHVEKFQPVLDETFTPEAFEVRLASTGEVLSVPAASSLLDVLLARGLPIRSSCATGICGSCLCDYLGGDVIHRDAVIQLSERSRRIAPCVSRARGVLTLEL
jgi:vanillate O-demethylase ferredoxin subunit